MECSHVQPNESLLYQYKSFIQLGESTVSQLGDQEISHVDEEEELVEIRTESSTIHQDTTGEKTPFKLQDKKNPAEDITNDFFPKYQKDEVEKLLELRRGVVYGGHRKTEGFYCLNLLEKERI